MISTSRLDSDVVDQFITHCKEVFGFLVEDYGFSGPEIEECKNIFVSIFYNKKQISIEITLDVREQDFDISVLKLISGKRHSYLAVDNNGGICRDDIVLLLAKNKRAIRKYFLNKKSSIREDLMNYKNLIINEANEILDGSAVLFDAGK